MLALASTPTTWSARPAPASLTRRGLRHLVERHLRDTGEYRMELAAKIGMSAGDLSRVLNANTARDEAWSAIARHFGFVPTSDPHIYRRAR